VALRTLRFSDPDYPAPLRALTTPPESITVEGGPLEAPFAVAIVGAREPCPEAADFAFALGKAVGERGGVVVSGGATGIDGAAHRGALEGAGRTWAVAATGRGQCFPKIHRELFDTLAQGPSAMVWPFPEGMGALPGNFLQRNGVLVALAETVVIVQGGVPSGTLSAFAWAQKLGRATWAVPGPPWDERFAGCRVALEGGARPLTSVPGFLKGLGFEGEVPSTPPPKRRSPARRSRPLSPAQVALPVLAARQDPVEQALLVACTDEPTHVDEIAVRSNICASRAQTGLLTLALENVLVEGPEGFYRRAR
jgi:DNA processing protein